MKFYKKEEYDLYSLFIKNYKHLFIIGIGTIFLHVPIEQILTEHWVSKIMVKIQPYLNDSIFFLISAIILYDFYKKIKANYYISSKHRSFYCFIFIFFGYYRFFSSVWTFTPLEIFPNFKYIDLLLLHSGLYIILFILINPIIIYIQKSSNKTGNKTKDGLISDSSIGLNKPDLLKREKLAQELLQKIDDTTAETAFTIGIEGAWGSGKTSFLDLIERNLNKMKNKEEFILVKFSPWRAHSEEPMIKDFFNTLSESLSNYHSDISNQINNYSELLLEFDNSFITKITKLIQKINNQTSSSKFEKINNAISKIGKKIIFFIDDLDRLDGDEILQVIKIIRNSANFNNLFFIVTYDKKYLISTMGKIYDAELYLEKIFQYELILPRNRNLEKILIKQEIDNCIKFRLEPKHLEEFKYTDNDIDFYSPITSLREAKKFCNSFLLTYDLLKEDIVLLDLLILKQIEFKFPNHYKELHYNPFSFLRKKITNDFYELNDKFNNRFKEVEGYSSEFIRLLHHLFVYSTNKNTCIANVDKFNMYFLYSLSDVDIPESEFNKYKNSDLNDFCKQIDKWIEDKKSADLVRKFKSINNFKGTKEFQNVVGGMFYLNQLGYYLKEGEVSDKILYANVHKLYVNNTNTNEELDTQANEELDTQAKAQYKSFILKSLEKTDVPNFEIKMLYFLIENYNTNTSVIAEKEDLEELKIKLFKKRLDNIEKESIAGTYNLYDHCFSDENNSNHDPNAKALFREYIKYNLKKFLIYTIEKASLMSLSIDPRWSIKRTNIVNIFDRMQAYRDFLNEYKDSKDEIISDYIKFYDLLEEKNKGKEKKESVLYIFNDKILELIRNA